MNKISSRAIIQQAISGFAITVSNEADMIEWIGDCIEDIGYHTGFVNKWAKLYVENSSIGIPCDYQDLNWIMHDGCVIHKGVPTKSVAGRRTDFNDEIYSLFGGIEHIKESDDPEVIARREELIASFDKKIEDRIGLISTVYRTTEKWFEDGVDNSCWKTNIEDEDAVIIYYKAIPIDKDGFPMVISEINYREALKHSIMQNLLARGLKHPVFDWKTIYTLREKFVAKARNKSVMFNRQQKESFIKNWTSRIQVNYYGKN